MKKDLSNITQKYLRGDSESFHSINSLRNAVQNYIQIRESWGEGKSKYGWRGNCGGRLFFNRRKTINNIRVMYQVLAVIDDDGMTFHQKVRDIKILKSQLSAKGVGRELLDVFLDTALSETSAYIPKGLSGDLESSIYIDSGGRFERREILGKGAFGEASRFQDPQTGKKVVLKQIHRDGVEKVDLEIETEIFQRVYNHLGKPYFGVDAVTKVLPEHEKQTQSRVVMPEIPGAHIWDFIQCYPNYSEEMLFNSTFNFLWSLHSELKIAHRDCHFGNIMVLDGLYNVFFIDYGLAFQVIEDGYRMNDKIQHFRNSMLHDLVIIITAICSLQSIIKKGKSLSLRTLIQVYNLERWRNYAFVGKSMETEILQNVNNNLIRLKISTILKL